MQVLIYEEGFFDVQTQKAGLSMIERHLAALGYETLGVVHQLERLKNKLKSVAPEFVISLNKDLAQISQVALLMSDLPCRPAWVVLGDDERLGGNAMLMGAHGYVPAPFERLAQVMTLVKTPNAAQRVQLGLTKEYVAARTHRGIELIHLENIYYFCADQKYVRVRHKAGTVLVDSTLKQLETQFSPKILRVHRNALINLRFLDALETTENGQYLVHLRGLDEPLHVSRRHLSLLKDRIYCA